MTGELHNAVIGFLALTPSQLLAVNQEDLTKEIAQQNLPATTWQYPNWSRKMKYTRGTIAQRAGGAGFRGHVPELAGPDGTGESLRGAPTRESAVSRCCHCSGKPGRGGSSVAKSP